MRVDKNNISLVTTYIVPVFAILLLVWNAVGKFYFFSYFEPTPYVRDIFLHISADIDSFYKALMAEIVFFFLQLTSRLPEYQKKQFSKYLYWLSLTFSVIMTYPSMYTIYVSWFNLDQFSPIVAGVLVLILVVSVDAYAELALLQI